LWANRAGLTFVGWGQVIGAIIFLGSIGVFYNSSGRNAKLAAAGNYAALWVAFSVTGSIFTYVMATPALPLRDAVLAHIDAALGFDWSMWSRLIEAHWLLKFALAFGYNSMLPLIIASIICFAHTGRSDRNSELLWTAMVSLVITTAIATLLPAVGPYVHFRHLQQDYSLVFLSLREGTMSRFALGDMQGIVVLPSFHTIIAILLLYSHRPPARSFSVVAVWCGLMLLSIPCLGHHYLADMIAGAAVAAVSVAGVRAASQRLSSRAV
jgi:hypothetical protein